MKSLLITKFLALTFFSQISQAHHSFAPYAINDPMQLNGVVESFRYVRPHPILELQGEDGRLWTIEVTPRNWGNTGLPESSDILQKGDQLRIRGWAARNGEPDMVMSGFELEGTYYNIVEQIRQPSACLLYTSPSPRD